MSRCDEVYNRRGTASIKYDLIPLSGRQPDTIPLWVADMDFPTPECVTEALRENTTPGIFGYSMTTDDYRRAAADWFDRRFGWRPEADSFVETPGVVYALCTAVRALTQPGDAVMMQMPVYHQFFHAVENNHRRVVYSSLKETDGRWEIDFEDFARVLDEEQPKLFLLCSPHNPVGRVWTEEELRHQAQLCFARNVIVVADEIHCDFVYPGHRHIPFLSLGEEYAKKSFSCTAPSKTFNLAGMKCSNIFIPDPELRAAFRREMSEQGASGPSTLSQVACQAAYEGGEAWLEELLEYLFGNFTCMKDYLAQQLPQIKVTPLEGTYLAWVDARGLGLSGEEMSTLLNDRARVWISPGEDYGAGGEGFWRVNLACPRSVLMEAMERICSAING